MQCDPLFQSSQAVVTSISVRGFFALYSSSALNSGVRSVNTLPTSVSTMSELQVRVDLQELAEAERQVVERAHELAEARRRRGAGARR